MTTIQDFSRSEVIQDAPGHYRVMSKSNICLFESVSPVKAIEYAEWFERHSFVLPKVLQQVASMPLPGGHWHPGDEA